jgi:hypothetical protein
MKGINKSWIASAALAAIIFFAAAANNALAAVPGLLNFQGKLSDPAGKAVTAAVPMVFNLYTAASGGSPVWTETQTVTPDSFGIYSVMLGAITPFNLLFSTPYWLGVAVGTDGEMLPRYRLASSAYALNSSTSAWAEGVDWPNITNKPALTLQGNAFNGVSQLVQLLSDGKLPALDGSNLTGMGVAALADGSVTTTKLAPGAVTDVKAALSTAAISAGKFGDDRVAISTGAFPGGFNGNGQLLLLDGTTAKVPYVNVGIGQVANTVAAGDDSRFHSPLTVAAIGATPNASGLTLSAQQLNLEPASALFGGAVTTGVQTFAGAKTFDTAITGPTVTNTINNLLINAGALSGITTLAMNNQLTNSYAGQAALDLTGAGAGISFAGTGPNSIVTAPGVDLALMPGGAGKVGIGTQVPNSTLQVGGSVAFKTTFITAPGGTALTAADSIVFADSTAGVIDVNLPTAVGIPGRVYTVVHTLGSPTVTVHAAGSELINDAAFKDLPTRPNEVTIVSDGAKWWILSNYLTP